MGMADAWIRSLEARSEAGNAVLFVYDLYRFGAASREFDGVLPYMNSLYVEYSWLVANCALLVGLAIAMAAVALALRRRGAEQPNGAPRGAVDPKMRGLVDRCIPADDGSSTPHVTLFGWPWGFNSVSRRSISRIGIRSPFRLAAWMPCRYASIASFLRPVNSRHLP